MKKLREIILGPFLHAAGYVVGLAEGFAESFGERLKKTSSRAIREAERKRSGKM
jgi:hypothetical protein